MNGVSIVIPAYNEESGIAPVVGQVRSVMADSGVDFEVIVVDDASTDGTAAAVAPEAALLIRHPVNRGYGASLKDGIRAAKFDTVLITDADGTYPIDAIPALLESARDHDMVVGSRTGDRVAIPCHRRIPKALLRAMANYLAGMKIPDLNSGLRVFNREAALRFFNIFPDGFSFTTTITLAFLSNGYRVAYLPINYHHREGRSKFRPVQDTGNLVNLILRTSLYFHPLKIFVPAGVLLFLLAAGILVYSKFVLGRVMDITVIVVIMSGLQMMGLALIADLIDKRIQR
ncbi:MAG TPA: glycosyltransferase family 2 protein [bacterium]|nr:glycosyltransferase family 2 protein [bacterium]HPQ66632.1 glycosyltransferase family 2 protein [bacterium]